MRIFDPLKKFRFRNFRVYAEARNFIRALKKTAWTKFPKTERFGLLSQLCRASDSVVLNIAEGCERGTDKDFAHFLSMSNASLNEVVACLDIAQDEGYIDHGTHHAHLIAAACLSNQVSGFRKTLLKPPEAKRHM